MVIKRMSPMSVAKVSGILYALLGLIAGAMIALVSMTMGGLIGANSDAGAAGSMFGMFMGVGAIVFFPICYGIMGFIFGAITAALYNLAAGWMGGIEIDVQ